MQELKTTIEGMMWLDILDIVLVAMLFYGVFAILRESRSYVALLGFITVMVVSLVVFLIARTWQFRAMTLIFQNFWIIVVLVFLIVFQNEFKKALTDIGQARFFRSLFPRREHHVIDEILQAVRLMAKRNVGALIVFERRNPLRSYTATGTVLDALVSADLIRTIFTAYTPLHDGALIVHGDRLVAAGCYLPLTHDPELSRELGTRHRAAIALTEESDAVVVVVSEETGTISLAIDGSIQRGLKIEELRNLLETYLDIREKALEPADESV